MPKIDSLNETMAVRKETYIVKAEPLDDGGCTLTFHDGRVRRLDKATWQYMLASRPVRIFPFTEDEL